MRRGTKIQKLKQALPGIVKDVRHYAKQDGKQCPQQQIDNECHTEQGHPEWKK